MDINKILLAEFKITSQSLDSTVALIDEGNTIPFIARYRKEVTGGLDDQLLRELHDRLVYLRTLKTKKEEVFKFIDELDLMTDEIKLSLEKAKTQTEVDDIYRPFRPKRKTRASVAKEKGLAPLSEFILTGLNNNEQITVKAAEFINEEKEVLTITDAITGALDIVAEQISDNANVRKDIRDFLYNHAFLTSVPVDAEKTSVYENYYEFKGKVSILSGYRILALNRGEKEDFLKISLEYPMDRIFEIIEKYFLPSPCQNTEYFKFVIEDSFKRLIYPSTEREIRNLLTEFASNGAIDVFSKNLRQLLLQAPVKNRVTLALDPAYRTGCKIAIVNEIGNVLETLVVFPTPPQNKVEESEKTLINLIKKYGVTLIAVGNGTASKESEIFVSNLIKKIDKEIFYIMVSEAGASVYSASKLAAEEFPELDVSKRSAISIARRLQDPLAELVKIDPKAIGVGQYQHDMPAKQLETALSGVVESCVNSVGVELNTASASLLNQVAGINSSVAKNIVAYRDENGVFTNRKELLKVPKLGKKAFLQAAGFIRVANSDNILDNTGVHPESYSAAKKLLKLTKCSLKDVENNRTDILKDTLNKANKSELAQELEIGMPTLNDIIDEILKPGRDPRDEMTGPILRSDILDIKDLEIGTKITGTVRNVIDFGAFVDIAVHIDGLVHISKLRKGFVKHPLDVVKVGDIVDVTVIGVDIPKKRISLSMIEED